MQFWFLDVIMIKTCFCLQHTEKTISIIDFMVNKIFVTKIISGFTGGPQNIWNQSISSNQLPGGIL